MRHDLPELPRRMRSLPLDERGFPVPWFVAYVDDVPDFRVIRRGGITQALRQKKCWLCGGTLGRFGAFVIGPMNAINRVSSEPPSHRDCAEFAVRSCPFLTRPNAKRREVGLPDDAQEAAGVGLKRNPGVTLLWVSKKWNPFKVDNGYLINVGEPDNVRWFAEGRTATRAEVEASVASGLPALQEVADEQSPAATAALAKLHTAAVALYPIDAET